MDRCTASPAVARVGMGVVVIAMSKVEAAGICVATMFMCEYLPEQKEGSKRIKTTSENNIKRC